MRLTDPKFAIAGITLMVCTAVATGHDGIILMAGLTSVAALGGYTYGKAKNDG